MNTGLDGDSFEAGAAFDNVRAMPGHLLRRCQQIAVSIFLQECRGFDLTPPQFAVLTALARSGPLDQVRLAGFVALDRTTVSVVVRKLERRGLVKRQISETDRRSKLIRVTGSGRHLLADVYPRVEQAQQRMLAPLSEAERRALIAILQKMAHLNNEESRAPLRGL